MKKRLSTLLLLGALCLGNTIPVLADTSHGNTDEIVAPYYENALTFLYSFDVSSKGKAEYVIQVNTKSASKIKITVEIQKRDGSNWNTVYTDSTTKYEKITTFGGYTTVDPSYDYRAYFTTTITYGDNQKETISEYEY